LSISIDPNIGFSCLRRRSRDPKLESPRIHRK
jgi:hypothetical protein